jgi:hypothetical protein
MRLFIPVSLNQHDGRVLFLSFYRLISKEESLCCMIDDIHRDILFEIIISVHYTEVMNVIGTVKKCPLYGGVHYIEMFIIQRFNPSKNRSVGPRSVHYKEVSTIESCPLWEVLLYFKRGSARKPGRK